jgi:hypothetical protein
MVDTVASPPPACLRSAVGQSHALLPGSDPLDALALCRLKARSNRRSIRKAQITIKLKQRHHYKSASQDIAVWQNETLRAVADITQQQDIDIDRPGRVAYGVVRSAQFCLNLLARRKQLLRAEIRVDTKTRVEKIALICDLTLGLCTVNRRGRHNGYLPTRKQLASLAQLR